MSDAKSNENAEMSDDVAKYRRTLASAVRTTRATRAGLCVERSSEDYWREARRLWIGLPGGIRAGVVKWSDVMKTVLSEPMDCRVGGKKWMS